MNDETHGYGNMMFRNMDRYEGRRQNREKNGVSAYTLTYLPMRMAKRMFTMANSLAA